MTKGKQIACAAAYELLTAVVFFGHPAIRPALSTFVFLLVGAAAAPFLLCGQGSREVKPYMQSVGGKAALALLSGYLSFASFGYRLFLAGDFVCVSLRNVLWLLLGALWSWPIVLTLLLALEIVGERVLSLSPEGRSDAARTGVLAGAACFAGLMVGFAGFYPGCFPQDPIEQMVQGLTGQYTTWHPILHTLLLKICFTLGGGRASAAVFAQLLALAVLAGRVAVIPARMGVKRRWIVAGALIFALLPNQIYANMSPLKDFPFTYAMVWASVQLFELAMEPVCCRRVSWMCQTALSLFLTCTLRHNGAMPFLFCAAALAVFTVWKWRKVRARLLGCVLTAAVLIGAVNGPLMSMLRVQEKGMSPYLTMFCAVGSCVNKGGEFSEETTEMLESVMPLEDWAAYYNRFKGHDDYVWEHEGGMDLSAFGAHDAFDIYLEALAKYPAIVIKDRLDGMNILWDITQPDESFNAKGFDIIYAVKNLGLGRDDVGEYEPYRVQTPIARVYRTLSYGKLPGENEWDELPDMLLWRSGAWLFFFFVLLLYWWKNRLGALLLPAMPLVGNLAAMALVLYHQSFRYVYFVQLLTIALLLMTLAMRQRKTAKARVCF